jgi:amino acid permease
MAARRSIPAWVPVFGVVFPTIVGGGILALPIALAPLGPVIGVLVVVIIGLLNVVTVAAGALTMVRFSGSMRQQGRLGTLVQQRFGGGAGAVTASLIAVLAFA